MSDTKPTDAKFDQDLRALQLTYIKRLSSQIAEFQRLHVMLGNGIAPLADLQILYRTSHNFAGSGTTFGFPDISTSARALHNALRALFDAPATAASGVVQERAEVIERLRDFILVCREAVSRKNNTVSAPVTIHQPLVGGFTADAPLVGWWAHEEGTIPAFMEKLAGFGYRVIPLHEQLSAEKLDVLLIFSEFSAADLTPIEQLRSHHTCSGVPCIVMAQRDDFSLRLASVRFGAETVLSGAPDLLRAGEAIEQALFRRRQQAALRVLVVDDDDMLADFYGHTLRHAGFEPIMANNAKEAVQVLEREVVDVAMINFIMPHCSGYELACLLRQDSRFASLPFIFISAKEEMPDVLRTTGALSEFLHKPFSPEKMVDMVRRAGLLRQQLEQCRQTDIPPALLKTPVFMPLLEQAAREKGAHLLTLMLEAPAGKPQDFVPQEIIECLSLLVQRFNAPAAGRISSSRFALLLNGDTQQLREKAERFRGQYQTMLQLISAAPPLAGWGLRLSVLPLKSDLSADQHLQLGLAQLA